MKNNHNLPFVLLMAWLISPLLAISARSGGVPDKGSMSAATGAKEITSLYPSVDFSAGPTGNVATNGFAPAALDDDLDFGDAPEGTSGYPTTLSNNGARHIIVPGIYLGNGVDFEPDGQPGITADCDDTDCEFPSFGDDEDGVAMPSSVSQGSTVTIVVSASVMGYLDVWMDFNHANGWADAGEHIFTTQLLAAGPNSLSFEIPVNAATGQSYVRCRFRDTDSPINFDGLVQNGEVEDYLINIVTTPNGNIDFGDAPEGTAGYPTTLVNNGARHTIVPGIYLGNGVDPEPNGQPGIDADCDDNDCLQPSSGDDEDGITIPSYISPGTTVTIGVVASVSGYLDGWSDFNHLNGWADAGEHVFTNTPLVTGSNILTFTVPANAVAGKTYVRFRFRDNANPVSFTGLASNGEVEDYAVTVEASPLNELDFGDAPEGTAGYPTSLISNGARHTIVTGIFLGNNIDPEPDGQPSTSANGDDHDLVYPSLGDDEDGVTIPSSVSPGSTVTIVVSASVAGYLDAWMDFNHTNEWADAGEHIFTNTLLAAGSNTLSFSVPGNAVTGQSIARFRFRTTGSAISFTGLVQNGEVEDYAVNIVATPNGNIDFGDAPEGTAGYPTTLANDGARHTIVTGIYLGNGVDPEPNGQPGIDADCDDTDCLQPSSGDDEDGITMPSYISPGSTVTVGVVASVSGYLDAWIDFNHLNGWSDAGEHIFTNTPLVTGSNALTFIVPDDAVTGKTYVRFRFRDNANPVSFTGLAPNGEVEDYSLTIEESASEGMDFGDAPEGTGSYPTALADNGARHTIVPGIFLGSSIDPEPDGQSSAIADGDDNDLVYPSSGDDEDGVILPDSMTTGSNVNIIITASVSGFLNAWIDFDKNGSWADAGEQIFTNAVLVSGPNSLTIAVPLTASAGNTFARFRFSTLSGLTFTGPAANGEVEDYMVKISEQIAPVAFNVTGGGSYCAGTSGLPVGLDGSEAGVTYTLYKNGDPQVPAIPGTGAAISFGDQFAGTYTVSGTNIGGTTGMTGSTVIAETPNPVATITASGPTTFCEGNSVTLTASPGGSYAWSNGATSQSITVSVSGNYTVTVTESGCSATSTATIVTVNPFPTATITPSGPVTICAGGSVTLTSSSGDSFLWSTLETTPAITVSMAGSYTVTVTTNGCSNVSDAINVTVDPVLPVSVTIAASANPVIAGNSVTFTATPVNGGTPVYQWFVNGIPAGSGLATYTYVPANGDLVYVMMTSSLPCVSGNPANSNTLTMQVLNLNKSVYGYIANPGTGTDPKGPITFTLSNPGNLTSIANQNSLQIMTAGTWSKGNWYGTLFNTVSPFNFIKVNTATGARTIIGNMGTGMNGLSYNPSDGLMYAVGSTGSITTLYTINIVTGVPTVVGFTPGVQLINLAINNAGQAYAVDLNSDVLGTINLSTGAFTTIGSIGFNAQFAQDMEFDRDANVLYITAYGTQGELRYVDVTTGATTILGTFEGGAEVTGFAIPYTDVVLAHNAGTVSIDVAPVITVGSVVPKATVRNFGANTETFNVTMTIGSYTSTKPVVSLASGASVQVTFDPWTNSLGNYTINVCTQLAGDMNIANDCKAKALKVLNMNKTVYGYNAYRGTGTDPEGPMTFTLSNPGNLTSIANQSTQQFVSGGTWANGNWYGTVYNTVSPYNFIKINTATGARTVIGNMGVVMNGLSYNPSNGIMYAVGTSGSNSNLYTINLSTGATTLVGSSAGVLLTNLAINNAGQAYALDLNADVLGSVNLSTGAFTIIGSIGFDAQYAQDMEFDREADVLYMAAEDAVSGWLGYVDVATGSTTKIGDFEGGADVTGFAIPYSNLKTLNLTAYIEGLYDGGGIMHQASDENGPHFGAGIADKVDVELHNAANYSTIEYNSGLVDITTNGNITISTIPTGLSGSYYITIRHRNSIETTTSSPVSFSGGTISYDFSTAASKAYGENMKLMGSVYAIWGGDVNQDGIVDSGDMNPIENASVALTMGYITEDVNGDGLIDSSDMNIVENNSIALVSVITP